MGKFLKRIERSPALIRALPFCLFAALTMGQGRFFEHSQYWIYAGKTLIGAGLVWWMWPRVSELRWKLSWQAVVCGVAVFAVWVGIDGYYPKVLGEGLVWNPGLAFGEGSAMAWSFAVIRLIGSTLVVPCLEEVFYRSFLYRWIVRPDFEAVPLGRFAWKPFLLVSLVFGMAHFEWLAGILCAFAYQGLVCWKGRLGDAVAAHAVTNFLLGVYVIGKGAWQFW